MEEEKKNEKPGVEEVVTPANRPQPAPAAGHVVRWDDIADALVPPPVGGDPYIIVM